jgi:hypothetical protein
MKIFPETQENHSCQFAYGKILHIMIDNNKFIYCVRCGRRLLDAQIHDKWKGLLNDRNINRSIRR